MSAKVISDSQLLVYLDQRVPRYALFSSSHCWSNVIDESSQRLVLKHLESIAKVNRFYCKSILKAYIQLVSDSGVEVEEGIYEFYCSDAILQAVEMGPNETDIVKYWIGGFDTNLKPRTDAENTMVVKENQRMIASNNTTGLRTWEAALYLANYMNSGAFDLRGKTVLELGAGTGMVGIALAKRYASTLGSLKKVILTDGSPDVVSKLDETVSLNFPHYVERSSLATPIEKYTLEWGKDESQKHTHLSHMLEQTEILTGADITYDSRVLPALCETISEFFQYKTQAAIIAATVRNEDTISTWHSHLDKRFPDSWSLHHSEHAPESLQSPCWFNRGTPEIRVYYILNKRTHV